MPDIRHISSTEKVGGQQGQGKNVFGGVLFCFLSTKGHVSIFLGVVIREVILYADFVCFYFNILNSKI